MWESEDGSKAQKSIALKFVAKYTNRKFLLAVSSPAPSWLWALVHDAKFTFIGGLTTCQLSSTLGVLLRPCPCSQEELVIVGMKDSISIATFPTKFYDL